MTGKQLRVALEELEWELAFTAYPSRNLMKAITAIKQALALDKMAENARELGLDYEPIAQDVQEKCRIEVVPAKGGLLPAAQRQWVGLTDEDIEQGCKESWVTEQAFQSAVWWAEAKLKEKNT